MFSLRVDGEIELSLPTSENIEKAFEIVMANYDHIHEWMPWVNEDVSLDSIKEFYRRTLKKFANDEDEIGLQIIYNGNVVGGIGFYSIDRGSKSAEIGYWLAKDTTGKGIITKSVTRLIDYAFDDLKLNRIMIKCATENMKSRAVPERLGFTQEGIEREAGWLHTRFVDHVVYSILAREWRTFNI